MSVTLDFMPVPSHFFFQLQGRFQSDPLTLSGGKFLRIGFGSLSVEPSEDTVFCVRCLPWWRLRTVGLPFVAFFRCFFNFFSFGFFHGEDRQSQCLNAWLLHGQRFPQFSAGDGFGLFRTHTPILPDALRTSDGRSITTPLTLCLFSMLRCFCIVRVTHP